MNMKYLLGGVAALAIVVAGAWFGGGLLAPEPTQQTEAEIPATGTPETVAQEQPEAPSTEAPTVETPAAAETGSEVVGADYTSTAEAETSPPESGSGDTGEPPLPAALDPASQPPGGATRDIGWMHGNCLVVARDELPEGTELTIVALDDPQTVRAGTITGYAVKDEDCTLLDGTRKAMNAGQGTAYLVETIASLEYGAAIIHPEGAESPPNPLMLDADEDEILDTFTRCLTKEGVRFSVWNAEPYNSKELWRGDYKLEGERVPTCPPE